MAEKFGMGDLWAEAGAVFQEHRGTVLGCAGAIAAGFFALDFVSDKAGSFAGVVVGVIGQYAFLQKVLGGQFDGEKPRYVSMWGSQILSGLGIVVGLVLLILPGLFLAARWMLAPALVVADGSRATESLSESWRATKDCWLPIALSYLILFVPFIAIVVAVLAVPETVLPKVPASAVQNLFYGAFTVSIWVLTSSAYRLLRLPARHITQVFD